MAAVTTSLIEDYPTTHRPTTVSVVVCANTEERWNDLAAGIGSLADQTHVPEQVVLVIDHDDDLLERAADVFAGPFGSTRAMRIDVVANTEGKGVSGARNTGVSWCDRDVVTFLDDDTRIGDPRWIAMMLSVYADSDVAGVGGGATPNWSGVEQPAWFPPEFGWVVGCSYVGLPNGPEDVRNFIGCNMSFRREVFDTLGGFSPGGRNPIGPARCQETEYCIRLHRRFPEARLVFDPALNVFHRVPPRRREFDYFRSRCWSEGVSKATVAREMGAHDGLATERAYSSRALPMGVLRGVGQGLRGDLNGFRRAGAIVLGALLVAAGYARGLVGPFTRL